MRFRTRREQALYFLSAYLVSAFLMPFLIPNVLADIYECNGVWTNRPCEQNPTRLIPEVTHSVAPTDSAPKIDQAVDEQSVRQAQETKKAAVLKLIGAVQRARREDGLEIDAAPIETLCESPATPPETCVQASEGLVAQIEQRVTEERLLKLREQEVQQDGADAGDSNVVVVQQGDFDNDYHRHRRRRPYPPEENTPYPPAQERTPAGLLPLNTTQLPLNTTGSSPRRRW